MEDDERDVDDILLHLSFEMIYDHHQNPSNGIKYDYTFGLRTPMDGDEIDGYKGDISSEEFVLVDKRDTPLAVASDPEACKEAVERYLHFEGGF